MITLKSLTKGLVHFLYPVLCAGCGNTLLEQEEVICLSCLSDFPRTGYHHIEDNESAMRLAGRIPFRNATSLAYFVKDGLLQQLLHGLKYQGRKQNGLFLGRQLGYSLLTAPGWVQDLDLVIPVPLHTKKEHKRGYNQSLIIARGLADILNIQIESSAIVRLRDTDSQTNKGRQERIENMREAFDLVKPDLVSGKHILLLDDVLTTGATLEACARVLFKADNVTISIATIGIAI